jgi:hypothetical protein
LEKGLFIEPQQRKILFFQKAAWHETVKTYMPAVRSGNVFRRSTDKNAHKPSAGAPRRRLIGE